MPKNLRTRSTEFFRQLFHDFYADDCSSMAAALSYYAIFSLPSLLLILIYIVGLVYGQQAASGQIQSRLGQQMGPQVAAEIQLMVSSVARNRGAGLIASALGLAGLLFSAISVVMQLQLCINRAWRVAPTGSGLRSFIMRRVNSGLLVVGVGVLMVGSLAAASVLAAVSRSLPFAAAAYVSENVISLLVFTSLFAVILKVLPDAQIHWKDVWLGAAVIAVLFEVGKFLIGLYIGHTGTGSTYGAAGSLALILLWTYYSALVFLFGVEITHVWATQHGREVEPKQGAVRIREPAAAET
jgi:membrane protein